MTDVNVRALIDGIKERHRGRASKILQGRRLAWQDVGDIFVAGQQIEGNRKAELDLRAEVEQIEEMQEGHDAWLASDHTVFEYLLVAAFGYEATHSKRHYYNRACENAKAAEDRPTSAEEFSEWVEKQGGLMAAAKGEQSRPPTKKPKEVISDFVAKLPAPVGSDEAEPEEAESVHDVIDVSFEPEEDANELGLLLIQHLANGRSKVLKTITKPKAIASVINLIEQRPSAFSIDRVERLARYDLNAFMLKKNRLWKKRLGATDFENFRNAVANLASDPELREKYFDGEPEVIATEQTGDINTMNEDAHVLDPARYIANAKPFALVPYELEADTLPTKDALNAIPSYIRWKENPPRRSRS